MNNMQYQQGSLKYNLMAIALVIVGLVALVWGMLPPTYSTDLSLVGKDKPAIVIVYESDSLSSMQLVEKMNPLRVTYEQQIHFILADVNDPNGAAFQRSANVHDGSALFYSAKGEKLFELQGPRETEVLKDLIIKIFKI